MNTRRAAELGWKVCEACDGEGRAWHGVIDATCMECKNTGLTICPSCRVHNVRQGQDVCKHCGGDRAA